MKSNIWGFQGVFLGLDMVGIVFLMTIYTSPHITAATTERMQALLSAIKARYGLRTDAEARRWLREELDRRKRLKLTGGAESQLVTEFNPETEYRRVKKVPIHNDFRQIVNSDGSVLLPDEPGYKPPAQKEVIPDYNPFSPLNRIGRDPKETKKRIKAAEKEIERAARRNKPKTVRARSERMRKPRPSRTRSDTLHGNSNASRMKKGLGPRDPESQTHRIWEMLREHNWDCSKVADLILNWSDWDKWNGISPPGQKRSRVHSMVLKVNQRWNPNYTPKQPSERDYGGHRRRQREKPPPGPTPQYQLMIDTLNKYSGNTSKAADEIINHPLMANYGKGKTDKRTVVIITLNVCKKRWPDLMQSQLDQESTG